MNNDSAPGELKKKLSDYLGTGDFRLEPLPFGASVRRYYRLHFQEIGFFPEKWVVLMQVPVDRPEIAEDYYRISSYLSRIGIPHPAIFDYQRQHGWIFMEMARGISLDKYYSEINLKNRNIVYKKLLDFLINLQKKALYEQECPAFNRKFDREKYQYEFSFHVKEQLLQKYFKFRFSQRELLPFRQFSEDISNYLDLNLQIFVHRDFQSSNIFYQSGNKHPHIQIIDFQDARTGHPLYDLVSLLWDSYVDLREESVSMLLKYFYDNHAYIRETFSKEEYERHIDYLVIQRKLHDAGAFAYTFFLTGNHYYIQYIDAAISMAMDKIIKYDNWSQILKIFKKISETHHV